MTPEFEVRYFLEHKVLPVAFYGDGEHLRKTLIHDSKNIMLQFYEHAEEVTSNYVCPYGPEDFELSARTYIRNDQFCIVLRMGMPQVEAPLLCRAVYLCYGSNESEAFYITSELAEMVNTFCVVGVTRECILILESLLKINIMRYRNLLSCFGK